MTAPAPAGAPFQATADVACPACGTVIGHGSPGESLYSYVLMTGHDCVAGRDLVRTGRLRMWKRAERALAAARQDQP